MSRFRPANLSPEEVDRAFRTAVEKARTNKDQPAPPATTIGPIGSFAEDFGPAISVEPKFPQSASRTTDS